MRTGALLTLGVVLGFGCRCSDDVVGRDGALSVQPHQLEFSATFVGSTATLELELTNTGRAALELTALVAEPFSVERGDLRIGGGVTERLTVAFTPTQPGRAESTLRLGALEVPLIGHGLEVPVCQPAAVCQRVDFDRTQARCVTQPVADETTCQTRCLRGRCTTGVCIGALDGCDDADACTLDGCDEATGCSHQPRTCPKPSNPCEVARCDAQTGCGAAPVPDGTLCGPDDCTSLEMDVCIEARCQRRPRPAQGRCANRWVPTSLPTREHHTLAWDPSRQQVLLFGGSESGLAYDGSNWTGAASNDTWAWDGARWNELVPATSPPQRFAHAMAAERARGRVVVFGGQGLSGALLGDTWEWDGVTWVARPGLGPSARYGHAACEGPRGEVVLFGGVVGSTSRTVSDETWVWNGASWRRVSTSRSPPARLFHSLAWDPSRGRVVLSGGLGSTRLLDDTWEFDGSDWTQLASLPAPRRNAGLAFDPVGRELVLIGGWTGVEFPSATLSWNGARWATRSLSGPPPRRGRAAATDWGSSRVVVVGGDALQDFGDTWEWDGTTWRRASADAPQTHFASAVFDRQRRRLVMVDGFGASWEWDSTAWVRTAAGLPRGFLGRTDVGGARSISTHLFELDGGAWVQGLAVDGGPSPSTTASTPLEGGLLAVETNGQSWRWTQADGWTDAGVIGRSNGPVAVAFDESRRQGLVVGWAPNATGQLWRLWHEDGGTWSPITAVSTGPGARDNHVMAYDPQRRLIVLHGGRRGSPVTDTWEWDGTSWREWIPVRTPTKRFPIFLVYDEARGRLVLFDGAVTWVQVL